MEEPLEPGLVGFNLVDNGKPQCHLKKPCLSVDYLFRGMNEKCVDIQNKIVF